MPESDRPIEERYALLSGTANRPLAAAIARELGMPLGRCDIERFPDGEISVRLGEAVREREVLIVQPTSPAVNDHLMELLIVADACRRAAAGRMTAIVPYFGYARSDRREARREPITASLVAGLLECAGITDVMLTDVHTPQTEGFFRVPVDHLSAVPELCRALEDELPEDAVVVSPDAGRVAMATEFSRRLGRPLVVLHKRRESGSETEVTRVVGDARDRTCLIIDDMISTGGTIAESAAALRDAGARPGLTVAATHGLLLDGACDRIRAAGVERIYVTDSVVGPDRRCSGVSVVTIAPLIAAALRLRFCDGRHGTSRQLG